MAQNKPDPGDDVALAETVGVALQVVLDRLTPRERVAFMAAAREGDFARLPVFVGDQPGSAWFHRGEAMVLFDFTVLDGVVCRITFRAEPSVLARVVRRVGAERRNSAPGRR